VIDDVVLSVQDVVVEVDETRVLDGMTFDVVDRVREGCTTGQIVSLLGPSGVGKTTLLRVLAGLTEPTKGEVRGFGGAPLGVHDVGIVFQDYPLFTHRTVRDNLLVAGKVGGIDRERAGKRADELLARIGLEDRAAYWPAQLSGGQRQRAAIAQQLVLPRRLLLLDEPFSGLDPAAIADVSDLVREVADEHELNTVLVVTHDVHAALAVSDTVLLVGRGEGHGARVADTYDLVDLGLAWGKDPRGLSDLARAVEARFRSL
jgi:polar amino acid transport system ATP-binding protein/sulfate transport system ATP-binding protein